MQSTEELELSKLGWQPFFQAQYEIGAFDSTLVRARVSSERPPGYLVRDAHGNEMLAEPTGAMRFRATGNEDLPVAGDWLLVEPRVGPRVDEPRATIRHVFDRKSCLKRKAAGSLRPQIIAANVDVALIVTSLNSDLNLRRLERYLALVWDSGAKPVLVMSKSDLAAGTEPAVAALERIAPGVPSFATSSLVDNGIDSLTSSLVAGETYVLIGSSGVGKSSLLNRLMGAEVMSTGDIRSSDDKGRHTTTSRELFSAPMGAVFIDTPGMRELGLWDAEEGIGRAFADVEELARGCRFSNCRHAAEPGCAIASALDAGSLDADRFRSYARLEREAAHQARKLDPRAKEAERARWKTITKANRARTKARERGDE